jgi:hypothetical protein
VLKSLRGTLAQNSATRIRLDQRKFPFTIQSSKVCRIVKSHVIALTGKAVYDVDHAPADHSNRSTIHENTVVFEITR